MTKSICDRRDDLAFPVILEQNGPDNFTVTYGKHTKAGLSYAKAASEYGRCVMHALACDGKLDNRTRREAANG